MPDQTSNRTRENVDRTAKRPATAACSKGVNNTQLQTGSSRPERRYSTGSALAFVCQLLGPTTPAVPKMLYKLFRQFTYCLAAVLAAALIGTAYAEEGYDYFDHIAPDSTLLRIVSADFNGGLYESSKSLATLFNWRHMPDQFGSGETVSRAIAVSTAGPLSSLEALMEGRAEFAIVRADLADRIFKRNDEIRFDARSELRLVSTHIPAMLHVVVRDDFEGNNLSDLAGKRVNIGTNDAATIMNLSQLLQRSGFATNSFEPYFAPVGDALRRLDTGSVDAVMFFDQAPSTLVSDALNSRKFRLLAVDNDQGNSESKSKFSPTSTRSQYFRTAKTADFYSNGQNSPALVAATYLLTRREVSSDILNSVISLLDIHPISTKPGKMPAAAKIGESIKSTIVEAPAQKQQEVDPNYYQQPFRVANWMSPIPLHTSAQVLIDIFTDPMVVKDLESDLPELEPPVRARPSIDRANPEADTQ